MTNLSGSEPWKVAIYSSSYWIGHDLTFRSVLDRSWIQHILRDKELSFLSMYSEQKRFGKLSAFVVALENVSRNCGHDYDTVRLKSIKIFQEVLLLFFISDFCRFLLDLELVSKPF